jgi:hypothetical protein
VSGAAFVAVGGGWLGAGALCVERVPDEQLMRIVIDAMTVREKRIVRIVSGRVD